MKKHITKYHPTKLNVTYVMKHLIKSGGWKSTWKLIQMKKLLHATFVVKKLHFNGALKNMQFVTNARTTIFFFFLRKQGFACSDMRQLRLTEI